MRDMKCPAFTFMNIDLCRVIAYIVFFSLRPSRSTVWTEHDVTELTTLYNEFKDSEGKCRFLAILNLEIVLGFLNSAWTRFYIARQAHCSDTAFG